jgi:hypothetical protein
MSDRFYLTIDSSKVSETSREPDSLLLLEDGSAVVCSVDSKTVARSLATGDEELTVRRHSELSPTEQRRVRQAV